MLPFVNQTQRSTDNRGFDECDLQSLLACERTAVSQVSGPFFWGGSSCFGCFFGTYKCSEALLWILHVKDRENVVSVKSKPKRLDVFIYIDSMTKC